MAEEECQTETDRFVPTPKELEEGRRHKRRRDSKKPAKVGKKTRTGPIRNFIAKIRSGALKKRTEAPAPPTPTAHKQPTSSPSTKEYPSSLPEAKTSKDTPTPPQQSTRTGGGNRIRRLRFPDQPTRAVPPTVITTPKPEDGPEKAEAMAKKKGHYLGTWKIISGATMGSKYHYAPCNRCRKIARANLVQPENYSSAHATWEYGGNALEEYCKNP